MTSYTTIISADALAANIDDKAWVIIDCRFDLSDVNAGENAYKINHIPNARYAHLDRDLSSPITPHSGRHPLPKPDDLAAKLGNWGINKDTQVVVYDEGSGAIAARLWWLMRWLGHNKVALLEGGYKAWQTANFSLSSQPIETTTSHFKVSLNNSLLASSDDVENIRLSDVHRLFDARAPQRFRGEIEPLDKIAGHIPGAINMPWENNVDAHGYFKSKEALKRMFLAQSKSVSPSNVVHSCGSGVTACHNVLAWEYAGLNGSKLYAGSWSEWIADGERATATGAD